MRRTKVAILCAAALISSAGACGRKNSGESTPTGGSGGNTSTGGGGGGGGTGGGPIITIDAGMIDAGMPKTVATGYGPRNLALGPTDIYWGDLQVAGDVGNNWLNKTPKDGSAGGWSIRRNNGELAVGATHLYQEDLGIIWKIPVVDGSSVVLFASGPFDSGGVAIDAANVYWTNQGNASFDAPHGMVMKASLATGEMTMLASDQSGAGAITVDATAIYGAKKASPNGGGAIMTMPLTGGTPVMLAAASTPEGIAIDGDSLYWMESGRQVDGTQTVRAIKKVPLAGGNPTTLVSPVTSSGCRQTFVVDGPFIYWAVDGAIMRMSVDGGPHDAIATGDNPTCLAVDQTHLFWISYEGRTVKSLPKP